MRIPSCEARTALFLIAIAVVLRAADFGNPVIHVDEQWYLLVGDRMLHGAVPLVDLWDRKPVGLFLLFAGIRLFGGDGILSYQVIATGFAAATAVVVAAGARTIGARERGAVAAGVAYLLGLSLLGGRGGQAPVFYDLPIALAGLLVLRLPTRHGRAIGWSGLATCLLAGLAIQIKYTAAVEAALFGLAHLFFLRRTGARWSAMIGWGVAMVAIGLSPTLAAGGWYLAHVHGQVWWFANFTSIALRPGYPMDQLAMRLLGIGAQLAPLGIAAGIAWRRADVPGVALAWLTAALIGFAAIGTWFDHYALPLLAPLAIVAAPTLARDRRGLVVVLGLMAGVAGAERLVQRDDGPSARQVAALVARESGPDKAAGRCPYVFIGDTITYLLARACVPTPYAFPNLLAYTTEQGATGIDEATEVRRILATRPPVIVTTDRRLAIWNRGSVAAVRAALPHYGLALRVRRAGWHTLVYVRRD